MKRTGALVAIAHPYGYFKGNDVSRMDAIREECDLDGIECGHGSVPPEYTRIYREYCIRHGLFSVAGSDCHDDEEIPTLFARHGGETEWLGEFMDRLGR